MLARQEGRVIGQEVASIGKDMILGPTVNIQRAPLWGRNFESYGEDPYLSGKLAAAYIQCCSNIKTLCFRLIQTSCTQSQS